MNKVSDVLKSEPVEKLMEQAEVHSQSFAEAWVKAQMEMTHAKQSGVNTFFKTPKHKEGTPYSTLQDVIDAVKPALNKQGIGFMQEAKPWKHGVKVRTVFVHISGTANWTDWTPIAISKLTEHGYGAALTYAKRYNLAMACGISADIDPDGNQVEPAGAMAAAMVDVKFNMGQRDRIVEDIDRCFTQEGEGRTAVLTCEDPDGLRALIEEMKKDNDLKMAVWNKLGSKVRSYIKNEV